MNNDILKNRKEILFLWDGQDFNPNGDMSNANAPRHDDETDIAEVSDVRIKRTIRDEIYKTSPDSIFVKMGKIDNYVLSAGGHAEKELNGIAGKGLTELEDQFLSRFIDIRAFGAVIPFSDKGKDPKDNKDKDNQDEEYDEDFESNESSKKNNKKGKKEGDKRVKGVQFTGPVQFKMSKSLNEVELNDIQGTCVFASSDGKEGGNVRGETQLRYAIFATHGIMDHHSAKMTRFTEQDAETILNTLWIGTKNLNTRTKFGQIPRFMLVITYKDDFYIGDMNNKLAISKKDEQTHIRSMNDYELNFDKLKEALTIYKEKIAKIEYMVEVDFAKKIGSFIESDWINITKV